MKISPSLENYLLVLETFQNELKQEKPIANVLTSCREYIAHHPIPEVGRLQGVPDNAQWGNA